MMKYIWITCLLMFCSSESAKVKERFKDYQIGGNVRVTIPFVSEEDLVQLRGWVFVSEIMGFLGRTYNLTISTTNTSSHGQCDPTTGLYSPGLKQMLHDNKTDLMMNLFRLDGHECDSGYVGPPLLDAGYQIITITNKTTTIMNVNILSYFNNLDMIGYVYCGIMITLVIIYCVILSWYQDLLNTADDDLDDELLPLCNLDGNMKLFKLDKFQVWIKRFSSCCSIMIDFMLVQSHDILSSFSALSVIYMTFFVAFIYYFYLCIMLNFMSVDQIIQPPVPKIESVADLFSGRFPQKPYINGQFDTVDVLSKALPGSDLEQVWIDIQTNTSQRIMYVNFADKIQLMQDVYRWLDQMTSGEMAVIERYFIKDYFKLFLCHHDITGKGDNAFWSPKIAEGTATAMFNKHMTKDNLRYVEYVTRLMIESDLYSHTLGEQILYMAKSFMQTPSLRTIKGLACMANVKDEDYSFTPGIILAYKYVFIACFTLTLIAMLTLLIEHNHYNFHSNYRSAKVYPLGPDLSELSKNRTKRKKVVNIKKSDKNKNTQSSAPLFHIMNVMPNLSDDEIEEIE